MKREHYVLGFLFDDEHKQVLLQKASCPWMNGRWNGIGGHIENDETPQEAMRREANEEAGIDKYYKWKHQATMICPGGVVFIFSHSQSGTPRYDKRNDQDLQVFSISSLPVYRMSNIDWMINLCIENPIHPPMIETLNLGV
jgi:8-oxo-dGTP pyrophosphatase MutT (NUDIX family)